MGETSLILPTHLRAGPSGTIWNHPKAAARHGLMEYDAPGNSRSVTLCVAVPAKRNYVVKATATANTAIYYYITPNYIIIKPNHSEDSAEILQ